MDENYRSKEVVCTTRTVHSQKVAMQIHHICSQLYEVLFLQHDITCPKVRPFTSQLHETYGSLKTPDVFNGTVTDNIN